MLRRFSCKLLNVLIVLFSMVLWSTISFASVNIPLDSPFYRNIDTLIACGLIKSDLSSTKPFTRAEAGRLLAEAVYYSAMVDIPAACSELLDRMAQDYEEEMSEATIRGGAPSTFVKPLDEFSITYSFLDGPFSIFNNEGIDYFDGSNALVQFQSRARLWRVFSFYIQPVAVYNENLEGIEGNDKTEYRLHKGYVKFTLDNFEIEWGKDSLWWGPGYHGSLLMSNNARPFDMIKISNPRATLLPSFFRYLGPFKYNLFFSELDKEAASEHPPDSKLLGIRFDFKPHPMLELGTSYLIHCNGERAGIGGLTNSDYLDMVFSKENVDPDKRGNNKQVALDVAITIPNISRLVPVVDSIKFYAVYGAEDHGGLGTTLERDYAVPHIEMLDVVSFAGASALLSGIVFNDIFMVQGLKLRAECARLSPKAQPMVGGSRVPYWYEHGIWSMKHYGRVFGHHAGTDSDDLFIELSHTIKDRFFYRVGFDKESSGISKPITQKKYQYFLEAGYDIRRWANFTIRYGYEEIDDLDNVKGVEQENHFIGTALTFTF